MANPLYYDCRTLYRRILEYHGTRLYADVLAPWLRTAGDSRAWLASFGARDGDPYPPASFDELQELYALSRISDLLLLGYVPTAVRPELQWSIAFVTPDEHRAVMAGLGLQEVPPRAFSPFFHEIVSVDASEDPDETVSLVETSWPGWMLGPLLIARAGCRVRGGERHVRHDIAEHSPIYWTYARHNRRAVDLSHGWGHNSQWRTSFRRDYAFDGLLLYNVDAESDDEDDAEDEEEDRALTDAELRELVRHRCFITCPKDGNDRWPYDMSVVEPATSRSPTLKR